MCVKDLVFIDGFSKTECRLFYEFYNSKCDMRILLDSPDFSSDCPEYIRKRVINDTLRFLATNNDTRDLYYSWERQFKKKLKKALALK